ncbi:hypothetical protein ACFU7Y_02810 [Kitasatospora sp. NPDC057542]|uniref:hypothetical protein n=1 Tax=Kitasatospora sp. NPDC057542 TaxID=3346162 RepID=UPI0036C487D5
MNHLPEYTWWGEVPAHLTTKTRLADLDLPRQPGGPARATIATRNAIGRKAVFDLYDVRESVPTSATAAQLAAAAARRTTGSRTCEECGARPEAPCTQTSDGWLLCTACAHIHRLRARQKEATERAQVVAEQAARICDDERLVVLAVDYTRRPPTDSGVPRPPAAARITVLDPRNALPPYDRTLRLTGPRTPGAPADAVDAGPALADLTALLAEHTVLLWTETDLKPLYDALRHLKLNTGNFLPSGHDRVHRLQTLAALWRADIDPATGHPRTPTPPGTADRLLYLLRRMATAKPVHHLGEPPRPVAR